MKAYDNFAVSKGKGWQFLDLDSKKGYTDIHEMEGCER